MASEVYRFRFDQPGLHPDQLIDDVGDPTTVVSSMSGGLVVDVTADAASQADVVDTMESKGFVFIGSSPVIDVEHQFKNDNNIRGLEFAIFKVDGGLVYDSNGHPLVKLVV